MMRPLGIFHVGKKYQVKRRNRGEKRERERQRQELLFVTTSCSA